MQHMVVYYILRMAFSLIFMLVYSQTPYKQLNECVSVCALCVYVVLEVELVCYGVKR